MTKNLTSRNVWATKWETHNTITKIWSLARGVALSVAMIITAQCITYTQIWIPEAFSMGWQVTQRTDGNQDKFEIRENAPTYEDEYIFVEKQGNKLVIKIKKIPNTQTIIDRSNIIEYVKKCYKDLEAKKAIRISQDWENKRLQILNPFIFEDIIDKTTQEFSIDTKKAIYIILLQNYLRSLKLEEQYEEALIFPEYYNNKKRKRKDQEVVFLRQEGWRQIATRFYAEGDPVIPIEAKDFNFDSPWWKKSREEYSKITWKLWLWLMEKIFWVPADKIIVQAGFNTSTLKKALEEWFTVIFKTFSPEEFQNNIMRAFISGPKQLNKRGFAIMQIEGITYVKIIK